MPDQLPHLAIGPYLLHLYRQLDLVAVADIALVAVAVYYLLALAKGTRAMQLLKGLAILLCVMKAAQGLGLDTLNWVIQQALFASAVVVVILFQPELRAVLDQLGRGQLEAVGVQWKGSAGTGTVRAVGAITKAVEQMAANQVGALIVIERGTGLEDIAASGTPLNAQLSTELLISIFYPGNPLHDGAVILRGGTLIAAACILPLTQDDELPRNVGTRHRAALGLSEMTDAIVVVVSEETGNVSLAREGKMNSILQPRLLTDELLSLLGGAEGAPRLRPFARQVSKAAIALPKTTLGTLRSVVNRR